MLLYVHILCTLNTTLIPGYTLEMVWMIRFKFSENQTHKNRRENVSKTVCFFAHKHFRYESNAKRNQMVYNNSNGRI